MHNPDKDVPLTMSNASNCAPSLENVTMRFGSVIALQDVSMHVDQGSVTCVLGNNGADKSTLIKILSGVCQPTEGVMTVNGHTEKFTSPREALAREIPTVFQDLATVPLMSVWRNFFLGNEPTKFPLPFRVIDSKYAKTACKKELLDFGIDIRDPDQPVGTLSGGERQVVAIARAVHFGANVLILEEPTSALGVKQSGIVLKDIKQAKERSVAVAFFTHNPQHAFLVGDRFYLLNSGHMTAKYDRSAVTREELVQATAGGAELEALAHKLESMS